MGNLFAKLKCERLCRPLPGLTKIGLTPDPTVDTVGYTLPRLRRSSMRSTIDPIDLILGR